MDQGTENYLASAEALSRSATDPYDALWWKIEVDAKCTLSSSEIHRRVMRALRKGVGRGHPG